MKQPISCFEGRVEDRSKTERIAETLALSLFENEYCCDF